MKLTNIFSLITVSLFSMSVMAAKVDLSKSSVTWVGSKVTGSKHNGTINLKNADIVFKKGQPASGKIVIDMSTIKDLDLTDPKWNKKLTNHLNSPDFFDVEKFKTSQFEFSSVKKNSAKDYTLKGKLTLKDVTHPFSVNAKVTSSTKKHQVVESSFKFDRTKYGIKYNSGKFFQNLGDKMISDEIDVSVKLHINM